MEKRWNNHQVGENYLALYFQKFLFFYISLGVVCFLKFDILTQVTLPDKKNTLDDFVTYHF